MKDSDAKNPKLTKAWWQAAEPSKETANCGMESALLAYEKAAKDPAKFKSEADFVAAFDACDELLAAIKKADGKCGKILQKSTKLCLKNCKDLVDEYKQQLFARHKAFKQAEAEQDEAEIEERAELRRQGFEQAARKVVDRILTEFEKAKKLQGAYDAAFMDMKRKIELAKSMAEKQSGGEDMYAVSSEEDANLAKEAFKKLQKERIESFSKLIKVIAKAKTDHADFEATRELLPAEKYLNSMLNKDVIVK